MFMKYHNQTAFTLAEVLITLGIIGIVAALTMPALIQNYRKKQFQSGLNKGYSTLLQAFDMYKKDNEQPLLPKDYPSNGSVKNALKPYLNVLVDCGDKQGVHGKFTKYCLQNAIYRNEVKYTYKTYSGNDANENYFDDGQLVLNDGSILMFENNAGNVYVSIDMNGVLKLPNKWGEDLFTFQLTDEGKLLPMGADGTCYTDESQYCSKTSTDSFNGIVCTARAIYDNSFWK